MNTCCVSCVSPSAGVEAVSVCTECLTVSAAGASLSVPAMVTAVATVIGLAIAVRVIRHFNARRSPVAALA